MKDRILLLFSTHVPLDHQDDSWDWFTYKPLVSYTHVIFRTVKVIKLSPKSNTANGII